MKFIIVIKIKAIIVIKSIKSYESYLSTENKLFFPTFYKTLDKLKVMKAIIVIKFIKSHNLKSILKITPPGCTN